MLANGALSDDGTELKIREQLIRNHLVEAIIILPRNLFYTTDISVTLWILNKNKKARVVEQNGQVKRYRNREDEILFMDLRQMGSPYEKKYIELTEEDRARVTSVYHNWQQEGYEIHMKMCLSSAILLLLMKLRKKDLLLCQADILNL